MQAYGIRSALPNILLGKLRLSQVGSAIGFVRAGTHGGNDCIAD